MDDDESTPNTDGPRGWIHMPATLSLDVTLAPHETKALTLQIPPDYDFMLDRITCRSDGSVVLRFPVPVPATPRPPDGQAVHPFRAALHAEYPAHLAALVGETLEDWTRQNAILAQQAWAGDDQAFLDLIQRDPRVVGSELSVAKVVSWRTELELFAAHRNLKASRLFPLTKLEEARARMQSAKRNLRRFGEVHRAFYDQRGKRPLPPAGVVKGLYYAFLCFFAGLKHEFQRRASRDGPETARRDLLAFVTALKGLPGQSDSFFIYIAWGVRVLDQLRIGESRGLSEDTLPNVVGPKSSTPSEVALDLTAQVFEISEQTVEALRQRDDVIPWMGPHGEIYAVAGRPNFDLMGFPDVQRVMRSPPA